MLRIWGLRVVGSGLLALGLEGLNLGFYGSLARRAYKTYVHGP